MRAARPTTSALRRQLCTGGFGANPSDFLGSLRTDLQAMEDLVNSRHAPVSELQEQGQRLVTRMLEGKGRVMTTGIGKSSIVAKRLAVSLSSVGVPSHFVHGTEWAHGDLGQVRQDDVVIALSHSGHTAELVGLFGYLKNNHSTVHRVAMVGTSEGAPLAEGAHQVLLGPVDPLLEPLGKVPTASIVVQEAIANGLVRQVVHDTSLTLPGFTFNHPGGSIGSASA